MKTAFAGKAVAFLQIFANKVVEISHQLQDFFKNGSFGVAVYPLLMHPCVRAGGRFLLMIVAALISFMGVFYLFAEWVSALFSEASLGAYFKHTTLEMLVTAGTIIDGKANHFSPLSAVMNAVFTLQGMCFVAVYSVSYYHLSRRKYWLLGFIFALFFTIGMTLIPSSQGRITAGGLQNFGATLTYLFGNFAILMAGIDFVKPHLAFVRRFSLQAGAIGILCLFITLFLPNMLTPVLERVGIYTVMVWEILVGFAMLKRK